MRFWRTIAGDRGSGGVLAILLSVLLSLQGVAIANAAAGLSVSASGEHAFVHCVSASADEIDGRTGAPAPHDGCCLVLCQAVGHAAALPAGVSLEAPGGIAFAPFRPDHDGHPPALRRARLLSEPRAPPAAG